MSRSYRSRFVLAAAVFALRTGSAVAAVTHSQISSARPTASAGSSSTGHSISTPEGTFISSFPPIPQATHSASSPASLVNLFIGTTNGGHVFPGSYGLTQAFFFSELNSSRCYAPSRNGQGWNGYGLTGKCVSSSNSSHESPKYTNDLFVVAQHAGYDANPIFNVTGFSQLHDDGTGGVSPKLTQLDCILME